MSEDSTATKAVPEGKYADIGDGLRIHYHEAGPSDGPAVLFLHGSGPGASGYSNFKQNFPYFAERGFRAIVPDTLGFGYSSKPDQDYGMDFVTGGTKRLLDSLGIERCTVIGNSHGGAMSISLALAHPEVVERLVLMAPGGLEETEVYMKMKGIRTMLKVFFKEGITREGMRKVFGLQLFDADQVTDQTIEERYQIAQTQPKRVLSTLNVPYLAPRLEELRCPIFALWGQNDQFCPVSGATTIAEKCTNARVMVLTECGHWVMVEHTDLFNRLCVDFIENG
jgi:4,5:9,10-diseco-3-hydroxy-5,9,17-trioxoandrosta-1(10),2-diene-4-oate hydrolase